MDPHSLAPCSRHHRQPRQDTPQLARMSMSPTSQSTEIKDDDDADRNGRISARNLEVRRWSVSCSASVFAPASTSMSGRSVGEGQRGACGDSSTVTHLANSRRRESGSGSMGMPRRRGWSGGGRGFGVFLGSAECSVRMSVDGGGDMKVTQIQVWIGYIIRRCRCCEFLFARVYSLILVVYPTEASDGPT